jgi:hypothetical protein
MEIPIHLSKRVGRVRKNAAPHVLVFFSIKGYAKIMKIMQQNGLGRRLAPFLAVMVFFAVASFSQAALTNLVTFSDFEGLQSRTSDPSNPPGSITPTNIGSDFAQYESDDFNTQYPQWNTQTDNDFQIQGQGTRSAPVNGADGSPTGNYLEILGRSDTGVITLTLDIPAGITAGANNATLNFDSWSQNPTSYLTTGRYRIVVTGPNNTDTDTGLVTINNLTSAWKLNTDTFTVAAGDTVVVSWSETNNSKGWEGLRIDDVQLLVDIAAVPEPAHIGVLLLALLMGSSLLKKRRQAASAQ